MKTSFKFFLGTIFLVCPWTGSAQVLTTDDILLQQNKETGKFLTPPESIENNTIFLRQAGAGNEAMIKQYGSNSDHILQTGSSNFIILQQYISGGLIRLQQNGVANQYHGEVTGSDIELTVHQYGGFNTVDQNVTGDQLNFTLIQEGSKNEIQHQSSGQAAPLTIYQRGNDMRVIVKSNN